MIVVLGNGLVANEIVELGKQHPYMKVIQITRNDWDARSLNVNALYDAILSKMDPSPFLYNKSITIVNCIMKRSHNDPDPVISLSDMKLAMRRVNTSIISVLHEVILRLKLIITPHVRLMHLSTNSVFGDGKNTHLYHPYDVPNNVDANDYTRSKYDAEVLVTQLFNDYSAQIIRTCPIGIPKVTSSNGEMLLSRVIRETLRKEQVVETQEARMFSPVPVDWLADYILNTEKGDSVTDRIIHVSGRPISNLEFNISVARALNYHYFCDDVIQIDPDWNLDLYADRLRGAHNDGVLSPTDDFASRYDINSTNIVDYVISTNIEKIRKLWPR